MKTFTKIVLALTLLAIYCTGYSANITYIPVNDGVFIPKAPVTANANVSGWSGTKDIYISNMFYRAAFDYNLSGKAFVKTLTLPKRQPYTFTANSGRTSMLGVNMINTNRMWDEGRLKASLTAYPNPSKGKFTISLTQTTDARYKITVSNTIGKIIKNITVPESAQNSDFVVDLSDKPAGVYFYSLLVNDKMVETKRLILQQ